MNSKADTELEAARNVLGKAMLMAAYESLREVEVFGDKDIDDRDVMGAILGAVKAVHKVERTERKRLEAELIAQGHKEPTLWIDVMNPVASALWWVTSSTDHEGIEDSSHQSRGSIPFLAFARVMASLEALDQATHVLGGDYICVPSDGEVDRAMEIMSQDAD